MVSYDIGSEMMMVVTVMMIRDMMRNMMMMIRNMMRRMKGTW